MDEEDFLVTLVKAKFGPSLALMEAVKVLAGARQDLREHMQGVAEQDREGELARFRDQYLS